MQALFRNLGLSERETKVYLALLDIGASTVGPIAAKTRMQHAKVYPTLEKLIDRGLVSYVTKSKTKHFQAENPRHLLQLLREKERALSEVIPELLKRQKQAAQLQSAKVYEGYEGMKAMFENILARLNSKSYYYVFGFKNEYVQIPLAQRFLRNIHLTLAEKNVDDRLIAHTSVKKAVLVNYHGIRNLKLHFTSKNFPEGVMIIDDRVINWIWGARPTAVEITSAQIAGQYKRFFLEVWKK